jgi:hypothetical protein
MPFSPRLRLPRRRQPSLRFHTDAHHWGILVPDPDRELVIPGFREAAMLALDIHEFPVCNEVLVLLDERRVVTAMLFDPPAEVGLFIGESLPPGVEAPFCQTLDIVLENRVKPGPPSQRDREGFHALRRAHMAQGLLLMDVLLSDGDNVRSLAIGCDPDPIWFEEFAPHTYDPGP